MLYDQSLSLQQIEQKIIQAYKHRQECIQYDESLSIEYRTQLAMAKEAAGETKAASYLRNINHIEAQRRLFRNIRHMEGKQKGGSTSKVMITTDDSTT